MDKKQLKVTCNFRVNNDNYLDTIIKLENIITTIKEKFEQKCICIARVIGKYAYVYIISYDEILYETLSYNIDYFSSDGNAIIEADYIRNIQLKIEQDYYRNALDIGWYRGTEASYILENVVSADIIDHKFTRDYPINDMNDFFTNGDITDDEEDELIPFD